MNVEDIKVGIPYKIEASGTSSTESWTVREVGQNAKEQWEVIAKGNKTQFPRTFRPEQFKCVAPHVAKKIFSESTELVATLSGKELWVERIDYMPYQERRGRKPKEIAA